MPAGTSIAPSTKPTWAASSGVVAVEASRTGRVCGAAAGNPPKPTIIRAPIALRHLGTAAAKRPPAEVRLGAVQHGDAGAEPVDADAA